MRRLIGFLVLLAFVAGMASPAIAACRMRAAQKECCCEPAPANSLCAPDCCNMLKSTHPIANVSAQVRALVVALPIPTTLVFAAPSTHAMVSALARAIVGLHERAAPRLPLRV